MSRSRSDVQQFRKLGALFKVIEQETAKVSAQLDEQQHRCTLGPRSILGVNPDCADPDCRRLRKLGDLQREVSALSATVRDRSFLKKLEAKSGRPVGSKIRDLVRMAEEEFGVDAPPKAIEHFVDVRAEGTHPDESTIRRYRQRPGDN